MAWARCLWPDVSGPFDKLRTLHSREWGFCGPVRGWTPSGVWTPEPSASSGLCRDKITELQDEAIAIAAELGMKPLLERVPAQREILKA